LQHSNRVSLEFLDLSRTTRPLDFFLRRGSFFRHSAFLDLSCSNRPRLCGEWGCATWCNELVPLKI